MELLDPSYSFYQAVQPVNYPFSTPSRRQEVYSQKKLNLIGS